MSIVVLYFTVFVIVFVVGISLQLKIIKRSRQRKPVAWQTEIFHAIAMMIHFSLVLLTESLVTMIPNYSVGGWICMLCRFIRNFGWLTISMHSLLISMQKYIVVVHRINDDSDRQKLEKVLLVPFLSFCMLWSAALIVRSSSFIPVNSSLENCFRLGTMWWSQLKNDDVDTIQDTLSNEVTNFCKLDRKKGNNDEDTFIYFVTEMYCVIQTVLNTMASFNIFEALVYYKIFQFINR